MLYQRHQLAETIALTSKSSVAEFRQRCPLVILAFGLMSPGAGDETFAKRHFRFYVTFANASSRMAYSARFNAIPHLRLKWGSSCEMILTRKESVSNSQEYLIAFKHRQALAFKGDNGD